MCFAEEIADQTCQPNISKGLSRFIVCNTWLNDRALIIIDN